VLYSDWEQDAQNPSRTLDFGILGAQVDLKI
jgi:hypothetical protein